MIDMGKSKALAVSFTLPTLAKNARMGTPVSLGAGGVKSLAFEDSTTWGRWSRGSALPE
jgi:hypothetical protein